MERQFIFICFSWQEYDDRSQFMIIPRSFPCELSSALPTWYCITECVYKQTSKRMLIFSSNSKQNPHKLKGMKVKLWTDSQSALQSIFSLKPTSRLVEETIELSVSAKLICQIEMALVCGHSGVTGNKVEDGMAKENTVTVQLLSPALAQTGSKKRGENAEHKWQQWWQTIPQCCTAKTFFAVPTTQHRKFTKGMSTKELTTLTQAATGHGLFAGHLPRWRESLPSTCKLCREAEETSLRLWGECPALKLDRTQLSSLGTGPWWEK